MNRKMGKGGVRERKGGKHRRRWKGGKGEWQDTVIDLMGIWGKRDSGRGREVNAEGISI